MRDSYDVAIVGGGAIGSAIAYFLTAEAGFTGSVVVIERDPTYRFASSALSASGIRQQYSTEVNIRISQFGIEFLRTAPQRLAIGGEAPAISVREAGYLVTAPLHGIEELRRNHALQTLLGARVAFLTPDAVRRRFPWIGTDDIGAACLGLGGEGWFDGYLLLTAFKEKARAQGADYRVDEVVGLVRAGGRIESLRLRSGGSVTAGTVVNAAGPHARSIATMAGVPLPVEARKRHVFVVTSPAVLAECPLVCDHSGLWFRPEGERFICGCAPDPQTDVENFDLEPDHAFFEERVWPALASRVPAFEALRPVGAWAGHYEYNTFDQNGIVGFHPEVRNFVLANGFSGHGLQQSPAVGRALADLIVYGAFRGIDLSALSVDRLSCGRPLPETGIY